MKLPNITKKFRPKDTGIDIATSQLYDYSTPEARQANVLYKVRYSQSARIKAEERWELVTDYYNGDHRTAMQLQAYLESQGIPFIPACVQDPFTHIESQLSPEIPTFEFSGRDDDIDSLRAKQREYVVQFVLDNNDVNRKNMRNERRLGRLGNAFWKVYWDSSIDVPGTLIGGDIQVIDVPVEQCFPDPSAKTMDECEYFNFIYPLHIRKAQRIYGKELKAKGITLTPTSTMVNNDIFNNEGTFNINSNVHNIADDTVEVIEHWYKDDEGDIACVILINSMEVRWIQKYWKVTGKQNKRFPFVKYCKIQDENDFWDRSEIENILELVDAADREMAYGLLNTAMSANDMIIIEENALADGMSLQNQPGGITTMKDGKINSIRRLQGLNGLDSRQNSIQFLQAQIERTVGNFDTSMGIEPVRVTTSSGIAQMNERADARKVIKKADRNSGFEDLFELIDWTCLEFYDDDRMIYIGASDDTLNKKYAEISAKARAEGIPMLPNMNKDIGPIVFKYSSKNMMVRNDRAELYFPKVDCTIIASDALSKSKAFNVQSIMDLLKVQITPQNIDIVKQYIDLLGLPSNKETKENLDKAFGQIGQTPLSAATPLPPPEEEPNIDEILSQLSPEQQAQLQQNPELIDQVVQEYMAQNG